MHAVAGGIRRTEDIQPGRVADHVPQRIPRLIPGHVRPSLDIGAKDRIEDTPEYRKATKRPLENQASRIVDRARHWIRGQLMISIMEVRYSGEERAVELVEHLVLKQPVGLVNVHGSLVYRTRSVDVQIDVEPLPLVLRVILIGPDDNSIARQHKHLPNLACLPLARVSTTSPFQKNPLRFKIGHYQNQDHIRRSK